MNTVFCLTAWLSEWEPIHSQFSVQLGGKFESMGTTKVQWFFKFLTTLEKRTMHLEDKNATADRILFLEWMYVNYLRFNNKDENTANFHPPPPQQKSNKTCG